MSCFSKKATATKNATRLPLLDVRMELDKTVILKYQNENGIWENISKDKVEIIKDEKKENEVNSAALEKEIKEKEKKLSAIISDLENEKKNAEELKKEFLLTEIRNEMLIQLAVRKNSTYENYAQEIEGHNAV